ncbi:hypothetical protein CPB83DRAFT_843651 [Crepidotus variabilis]|uniref:Uncharacterized protein n=1 Tax=Crepidotus variabilis TaxID=179855 RepID=A0A9P6EUM6_9AGAR|nr:hypothetical protein CPB83DRAFT_843651 [Crepidotus variabilis]
MSSMWANLILPGRGCSSLEDIQVKLRFYVERARSRGLFLSIINLDPFDFETILHCVFLQTTAHWAGVFISAQKQENIKEVLEYFSRHPEKIPNLSSFGFRTLNSGNILSSILPPNLTSLSSLRALRIEGFTHPFALRSMSVDWGRLTSLRLHIRAHSVTYLDILSQCHHLEHLYISPLDEDIGGATTIQPVELPTLRQLLIKSRDTPSYMLRRLVTPFIERLSFDFPGPKIFQRGLRHLSVH